MSIKRYENTGEIIGQFLPKVYTRRITLESIGNDPKSGQTAVTVDYQIKDILDQNGLGIITQTRKEVIEGGKSVEEDMQDDILKALKVIVIAIDGDEEANRLANQLYTLANSPFSSGGKNFEQALNYLVRVYKSVRIQTEKNVNLARPPALGFEFRNTIYQQFDINNNVVNIIPGEQTFILDNQEWDNIENLSIICFSYFDFESLGLTTDNFSSEDARKLSYTIGDLTLDAVTRGGKIVSTASIYKIADTGEPYYGPVHYHGNANRGPDDYVGYMAGYAGSDMGPKLNRVQVPITKIQDFRAMQRTKLVNYQPDQLEYFNNRKPDLSFLDRGDKNYFNLSNVIVNYDNEERETNIEFTINMYDIFKRNSRYYDLVKNVPGLLFATPSILTTILDIRIIRRRMTSGKPGTTRLGSPKRIKFMPESEDEHLVVASSDGRTLGLVNEVVDDELGSIVQSNRGFATRTFKCSDYQIADFHGTNGIYQYGVELRLSDNTKSFMLTILERARRAVKDLKIYSQQSKIPVFDTYNVRKPEENLPIGLAEDPVYSESIATIGNYDTKTRTFTKEFIRKAKEDYDFRGYVRSFKQLLYYSFGKSDIKRTRRASETLQIENQSLSPLSALEALNSDGVLSSPEDVTDTELYNMINPSNTNPETIDSFIRSFEDLVLEMEEFFGSKHNFYISSEGSGYSAKGDYTFTVQRWLNSTNYDVDVDTLVHMEPFTNEISFDYDLAFPRYAGIRTIPRDLMLQRFQEEQESYGIPASNPISISPKAINIGSWTICFSKPYLKKVKSRVQLQIKEADGNQRRRRRRRRGKRRSYVSRWKRKKDRLSKKRFLFLDPSSTVDTNSVSNFVTGLRKLSVLRGPSSPSIFLKSIETLETYNFFEGIRAINDSLSNNIVNYGSLVDASTLVDISRAREVEYPENPNECGLIDNTPKDFRIPLVTDFLQREGFFFGFGFAQEEVLPPIYPEIANAPPISTIPQAPKFPVPGVIPPPPVPQMPPGIPPGVTMPEIVPQMESEGFPTGGIYDDAMVFPVDKADGVIATFAEVGTGAVFKNGTGIDLVPTKTLGGGNLAPETKGPPSPRPTPGYGTPNSTPTPSYGTYGVDMPVSTPMGTNIDTGTGVDLNTDFGVEIGAGTSLAADTSTGLTATQSNISMTSGTGTFQNQATMTPMGGGNMNMGGFGGGGFAGAYGGY